MTHPHTDSTRAMLLLVCALCIPGVRSAPTPADAVHAAHAVALPDKDAILQAGTAEADKTFEGFGGVHPEKATEEKALYQSGMGALYEPAVGSVVRCRDREDPTCRAVQILDRGFPERPPISDDILIGRDEVVGNAEGNPAPDIDNGTRVQSYLSYSRLFRVDVRLYRTLLFRKRGAERHILPARNFVSHRQSHLARHLYGPSGNVRNRDLR